MWICGETWLISIQIVTTLFGLTECHPRRKTYKTRHFRAWQPADPATSPQTWARWCRARPVSHTRRAVICAPPPRVHTHWTTFTSHSHITQNSQDPGGIIPVARTRHAHTSRFHDPGGVDRGGRPRRQGGPALPLVPNPPGRPGGTRAGGVEGCQPADGEDIPHNLS
jgi:hypothetical protein